MGGQFETSDQHSSEALQPLKVPTRKEDIYGAAKEMIEDLDSWELVAADDDKLLITARRNGGFLSGVSTLVVSVEGPDGIPSATVNVCSTTQGGLPGFSKDKANVLGFLKPFNRRVC